MSSSEKRNFDFKPCRCRIYQHPLQIVTDIQLIYGILNIFTICINSLYIYTHSDDIHLFYLTYLTSSSRVFFSIQVNLLPQYKQIAVKMPSGLGRKCEGIQGSTGLGRKTLHVLLGKVPWRVTCCRSTFYGHVFRGLGG